MKSAITTPRVKWNERYTVHAQRDFFLGGWTAIVRRKSDGMEVLRSIRSFGNRQDALGGARAYARDLCRRW